MPSVCNHEKSLYLNLLFKKRNHIDMVSIEEQNFQAVLLWKS